MEQLSLPSQVQLPHRGLFRLPDAAGVELTCSSGALWVTLDSDPRDIVLERGERFVTSEHRPALIYALEASQVSLTAVDTKPRRVASVPARQALRVVASLSR